MLDVLTVLFSLSTLTAESRVAAALHAAMCLYHCSVTGDVGRVINCQTRAEVNNE